MTAGKHIGILGTGLIGHAFAERYLSQDYAVSVYNRSREKTRDLEKAGAVICADVNELLTRSDIVILMLSNAEAIHERLPLHDDNSLQGKTLLQMATISPQQSRELERAVSACGGGYLEAPVLGSIPEAKTGTLIIMAGGEKAVFDRTLPVLQVLGNAPRYIGKTGSGAALKLAMNQLIASLTAGFSLSLGYALANEVDADLFMNTVRESALYAKTYDKKLEKYLQRDFGTANFSTRHLFKDIRLFMQDAKATGLNTAALEGIARITEKAVDNGMALMDYSSIYEIIDPQDKDRPE